MASFRFVTANGKTICRGDDKACITPSKNSYSRKSRIPKGSKTLEIFIYGAGGSETAYYCEVCTITVLNAMHRLLKGENEQTEQEAGSNS